MKFVRFFLMALLASAFISCTTNKSFHNQQKEYGAIVDGSKVGKWIYYYDNGALYQQGRFINGKETGRWKIYHENGNLWQEGKFKKGLQHGKWIFFYSDGTLQGKGHLDSGKYVGKWTWYHENGNLYTERLFKKGKLIEIIGSFDGYGNAVHKGTFFNGNGSMYIHNCEGKIIDSVNYKSGNIIKNNS